MLSFLMSTKALTILAFCDKIHIVLYDSSAVNIKQEGRLYMRNPVLVNKKFHEFFFPTILMSASASLSLIIDSIIVGNILGDSALAAVNLIMPMSLCFTAISAMFGIGSSTLISMLKGKMENEKANSCFTLSILAWVLCSVISVLVCLTASVSIAAFLSGDSGLRELVYNYLKIYLFGAPFTFATLIFPHIIKTDGLPRLSSNSLIVANVTNLALDIVFMSFLNLGIKGAALATVTGNAVGTLFYIIYIKSKSRTLHLVRVRRVDLKLYADMFKMSISSIFGQALMFAKMWIFNMIVASTAGQAGLTAFSICTSCLSFVSMFISGGAQTMIPMVGAFNGAEDQTAICYTVKKAFTLVIGCCVAITVLFELFPEMILSIYGVTGGEVLEIGRMAVRIFALSFVFTGFSFMFMYYLQAKKIPSFAMQICALDGFFFIVPLGILFAWFWGSNGIWLSYIANGVLVLLFILLKAGHTVKKSNGAIYSLFMLKRTESEAFELSVDVFSPEKIETAIQAIADRVQKEQTEEILRHMFAQSVRAYREKTGLRKNNTVDIILSGNMLSFKDMGAHYALLEGATYTEEIKKLCKKYEYTLLIGMNYATVLL